MQDRHDFKHTRVANDIINDTSLKAADKAVYMVLSMYADNDTAQCYPKRSTILEKAGVSDKTLRNALNRLVEKEYIAINTRYINGERRSNIYTLL